jgi:hypothetical protein
MKKTMKLAIITTLMAIGIATANAQTTTTNVVLNANISLSGFVQAGESNAAPVRIANKEIFLAYGTSENGHTVAKGAKLIVASPADGGEPTFFIREKTGTDVTDTSLDLLMTVSTSAEEVVGANGVRYTILTLNFDNGMGTDFSVSGFATLKEGSAKGTGTGSIPGVTTSVSATVSGSGHVNGEDAILKGTFSASGAKAEVVEIP